MQRELRGCFDFFWKEWISDPASPTYGMTSGDYVGLNKYSPIPVESQGFYFAAIGSVASLLPLFWPLFLALLWSLFRPRLPVPPCCAPWPPRFDI